MCYARPDTGACDGALRTVLGTESIKRLAVGADVENNVIRFWFLLMPAYRCCSCGWNAWHPEMVENGTVHRRCL